MADVRQRERSRLQPQRLTPETIDRIRPVINVFKLVIAALIGGVIVGAVVISLIAGPVELILPPETASLLLMGISVVAAIQSLIVPSLVRRAALNRQPPTSEADASRLVNSWTGASMVGAALLESAAFLNLVGLFFEPNVLHLALAAVFAALIFVHYPRTNAVLDWIEQALSGR